MAENNLRSPRRSGAGSAKDGRIAKGDVLDFHARGQCDAGRARRQARPRARRGRGAGEDDAGCAPPSPAA
jgi:hypothetical protein